MHYYAYAALGTDRYPPFTLADVPDCPARLDIDYPARLSRGLVLVKWWLLALPFYVVVALFAGGGLWLGWWPADDDGFHWGAGGLIGVLVLIAGVLLLVTGQYPRPVYDFVLGMDRWVVRVGAYAALLTDEYPPFRLGMGGTDPAGPAGAEQPDSPVSPETSGLSDVRRPRPGWTGGRIAAVVAGAVLALTATGLLTGGAALLWADRVERDPSGYLTVGDAYSTGGYAIVTEPLEFAGGSDLAVVAQSIGDVRIRVTAADSDIPVFVGIASADAAARYLCGIAHATIPEPGNAGMTIHSGRAPQALATGVLAAGVLCVGCGAALVAVGVHRAARAAPPALPV